MLIVLLLTMGFRNYLTIPIKPLSFFVFISTITSFTAIVVTPIIFNIDLNELSIVSALLKLTVTFLYLVIGYNLSKIKMLDYLYKWYSITALVIGAIGFVFSLFGISILHEVLFFAGYRYQGLMQDPNYFSILLLSALPFFVKKKDNTTTVKMICGLIIFLGVLVAGSKTGTIVFFLYITFINFEYLTKSAISKRDFLNKLLILFSFLFVFPVASQGIIFFLERLSTTIPIIDRVTMVFTNFDTAINGEGSSRLFVYLTGFEIIKKSPIIGIGSGTYGDVAYALSGSRGIAHNTFIQLTAEWGLPIVIIFFSYIAYLLIKISNKQYANKTSSIFLRDVMIILLLGSLAISLNNARIFWLVLGAIIHIVENKEAKQIGGKIK